MALFLISPSAVNGMILIDSINCYTADINSLLLESPVKAINASFSTVKTRGFGLKPNKIGFRLRSSNYYIFFEFLWF